MANFIGDGVLSFLFRVKFYTPDPCRLQEEYTRYHFFMQLKLDIAEKRLWCGEEVAILLASYAVQCKLTCTRIPPSSTLLHDFYI